MSICMYIFVCFYVFAEIIHYFSYISEPSSAVSALFVRTYIKILHLTEMQDLKTVFLKLKYFGRSRSTQPQPEGAEPSSSSVSACFLQRTKG